MHDPGLLMTPLASGNAGRFNGSLQRTRLYPLKGSLDLRQAPKTLPTRDEPPVESI